MGHKLRKNDMQRYVLKERMRKKKEKLRDSIEQFKKSHKNSSTSNPSSPGSSSPLPTEEQHYDRTVTPDAVVRKIEKISLALKVSLEHMEQEQKDLKKKYDTLVALLPAVERLAIHYSESIEKKEVHLPSLHFRGVDSEKSAHRKKTEQEQNKDSIELKTVTDGSSKQT